MVGSRQDGDEASVLAALDRGVAALAANDLDTLEQERISCSPPCTWKETNDSRYWPWEFGVDPAMV